MRLLHSEQLSYDLADLESDAAEPPERPAKTGSPARTNAAAPAEGEGAAAPATPAALTAPPVADVALGEGPPSTLRRRQAIRELFLKHGRLTAIALARSFSVSANTVSNDLRALVAGGLIEKVEPKRSPRTHYFRIRAASGASSSSQAGYRS